MIGLSAPVANAKDIAEWIGAKWDAKTPSAFAFHPNVRPLPLEVQIQAFDIAHFGTRMVAMGRPAYNAITQHSPDKPVLVFVPSRKLTGTVALSLITDAGSVDSERRFLRVTEADIEPYAPLLFFLSCPLVPLCLG